jgi:hypothetical protein
LSAEKAALIEKALGERLSQRAIARTLGVSRDTVRKTGCVQHLDDLKNRLWMVLEKHNLDQIAQLEKLTKYPL